MLSETIFYRLMQWPKAGRYWIAFSGGADSQSLLSALVELRSSHNIEISLMNEILVARKALAAYFESSDDGISVKTNGVSLR